MTASKSVPTPEQWQRDAAEEIYDLILKDWLGEFNEYRPGDVIKLAEILAAHCPRKEEVTAPAQLVEKLQSLRPDAGYNASYRAGYQTAIQKLEAALASAAQPVEPDWKIRLIVEAGRRFNDKDETIQSFCKWLIDETLLRSGLAPQSQPVPLWELLEEVHAKVINEDGSCPVCKKGDSHVEDCVIGKVEKALLADSSVLREAAKESELVEALNRMLVHFAGERDEELCIECDEKIGTGKGCDTCYVIGKAAETLRKFQALADSSAPKEK